MASLTAEDLQREYGQELAAPPKMDIETAFLLRKALLARHPPLDVTVGVLKQWLKDYRPLRYHAGLPGRRAVWLGV